MNVTIRNIDKNAFRELKARAALAGKTIGELLSEAMKSYLATSHSLSKKGSIRDLKPKDFPPGNETLSDEIDEILYGSSS